MVDGHRYSTGQRVAFVGLLVGFLITLGIGCTPFWKKGKISVADLTSVVDFHLPFIGDVNLIKFDGGLVFYCLEVIGEDRKCQLYDFSHSAAYEVVAILTLVISLKLSLVGFCAMCCCSGGRTICQGVTSFIAGCLRIATVVLFAMVSENSFEMKLSLVSYNWAFYTFIAGACITILSSFILCCAYPDSPVLAVLPTQLTHPAMTIMTSQQQSSQYHRLQEDNMMNSFPPPAQPQAAPGYPAPNSFEIQPMV